MMSKHGNKKQFWFRTTVTWILVVLILLSMPGFLAGCRHPVSPSKSSQDGPADSDASLEVFGRLTEYSTYKAGELLKDTFYCNDAWFGDDPAKRNDALALLSMQLTAAAVTSEENGSGALALRKLGFDRLGFVGFGTDDSDDCAYTWATKKIGDKTLVAIVFQSYALDSATKVKAWKQNFHVNDEDAFGEHAAFKKASEKVLDGIASLGGENARFWIMGQSRGGALANLVAAKLSDKLGGANGRIYAYTFEAPATVDGALAQTKAAEFAYIHNYIASDDMVPLVPMWE